MDETWWDGGSVELPLTALEKEFSSNGNTYWRLNVDGHPIYGLVKPYRDNIPFVVDELKRVFHLVASGTKRVYFGATPYLLYQAKVYVLGERTLIQDEPHLSEVKLDQPWSQILAPLTPEPTLYEVCKSTIQRLYAFRDLIGLTPNNNTIFKIRSNWRIKDGIYKSDLSPHPITQQDNTIRVIREKNSLLPQTVLAQWFDNISVSDVVCSMTSFGKEGEKIHEKIAQYRNEIERVINRVDRNLIWISGVICERLMTHYIRATTTTIDIPWTIEEFDDIKF